MSTEDFIVNAVLRSDVGKGASRRLRHAGKVPAILYGGDKDPQSLTLTHNEMLRHVEHEAFFSHILTVNVGGQAEKAILKDIQWHPFKPLISHMDFMRVDSSSVIRVHVPLHFVGEDVAPGAKAGGVVTHQMNNIEVSCRADALPEFLEADVSGLGLGESLHLSQIKLPKGIEIIQLSHGPEHDLPVVTIVASRASVSDEGTSEGATEEGGENE